MKRCPAIALCEASSAGSRLISSHHFRHAPAIDKPKTSSFGWRLSRYSATAVLAVVFGKHEARFGPLRWSLRAMPDLRRAPLRTAAKSPFLTSSWNALRLPSLSRRQKNLLRLVQFPIEMIDIEQQDLARIFPENWLKTRSCQPSVRYCSGLRSLSKKPCSFGIRGN